MQYKYQVRLETLRDVASFVATINTVEYEVRLTTYDNKYTVSAKSMIGAIATVDWNDVWVISDNSDLYNLVRQWVI